MDPTWPPLRKIITEQGTDAIVKVEPRLVAGVGRGLFATEKIDPLQTLVSIPGHLLFNAKTLAKTYPNGILPQNSPETSGKGMRLTSVQLLSLHLYRWRRGVSDPVFEAYIDSLPRSFPAHPLTILIMDEAGISVLDSLPASVANMLVNVKNRLKDDWGVVVKTLKKNPALVPPLDNDSTPDQRSQLGDFVWAWLNVNTRCLCHDLGFLQSGDNITMCPLLDFANHTPLQSQSITQDEFAVCNGMAFSSSTYLRPGDEVYLRYGGHSNTVLFAEYGFVLPADAENMRTSDGEISIDSDVEELLRSCQEYETKVQLLKDRNYWGDWTLYAEGGIGHPSFRLFPALRLFHISIEPSPGRDLELWENTLLGMIEIVSPENESKVRDSVTMLCRRIMRRDLLNIPLVQSRISIAESSGNEGNLQVLRMAKMLWEEEYMIAELVEKSIVDGIQF